MSLNIPDSLLRHSSSVGLVIEWSTFSDGQKKNILKPITTGVGRRSWCTTASVSKALSRKFKIPVCRVENSQLDLPKNLPDGHPVVKLLSEHYKLCKIISPELSQYAEEHLDKLHNARDISGAWRLYFYHKAFDKKHYVQFKKDLVFPTQVGDEAKSTIDKLKNDQVNTLRLNYLDGSYYKLIATEVT